MECHPAISGIDPISLIDEYYKGVHVKKIEIIPKDSQMFTYKCLTFLNFLTYSKICQNFSLITKKLGKFQIKTPNFGKFFSLKLKFDNFSLVYSKNCQQLEIIFKINYIQFQSEVGDTLFI